MIEWSTQTVYIIGGGPSAGRVDLAALDGIVVGLNDSAVHAPCDVAFSASPPWVKRRRAFLKEFPGTVVIVSVHGDRAEKRYGLHRPVVGVPLDRSRRVGHNSGLEALCWVVGQGARDIVLIGYDMDPAEPTNWHAGYTWMPDKRTDPTYDVQAWVGAFDALAKDLADDVTVRNANPESHLRCFPFMELQCVS